MDNWEESTPGKGTAVRRSWVGGARGPVSPGNRDHGGSGVGKREGSRGPTQEREGAKPCRAPAQ